MVSLRLFVAKNVGLASVIEIKASSLSGGISPAKPSCPFVPCSGSFGSWLYSKSVIVHIYWISGNFTTEESVLRWNLVSLVSKLISVFAFSAIKAYPLVDGDLKL